MSGVRSRTSLPSASNKSAGHVRVGSITPVLSCPRLVRSPSESGRRADLSTLRPRTTTGHFGALDLRLWERLVWPDGWLAVSSPLIRCRIPAESTGLWSLRGRTASNADLPPFWPRSWCVRSSPRRGRLCRAAKCCWRVVLTRKSDQRESRSLEIRSKKDAARL